MTGQNSKDYERVYERLRKRSYRRLKKVDAIWDKFVEENEYHIPELGSDLWPDDDYGKDDHAGYVRGVRDTLNMIYREYA